MKRLAQARHDHLLALMQAVNYSQVMGHTIPYYHCAAGAITAHGAGIAGRLPAISIPQSKPFKSTSPTVKNAFQDEQTGSIPFPIDAAHPSPSSIIP